MTKVSHPHADRDAAPAAVTVGTTTYAVDADGVIDCPDEDAAAVADALAEAYGVDASELVDENTTPDYTSIPTDLDAMTYDELYDVAADHGIEGRSSMTKSDLIDALED